MTFDRWPFTLGAWSLGVFFTLYNKEPNSPNSPTLEDPTTSNHSPIYSVVTLHNFELHDSLKIIDSDLSK